MRRGWGGVWVWVLAECGCFEGVVGLAVVFEVVVGVEGWASILGEASRDVIAFVAPPDTRRLPKFGRVVFELEVEVEMVEAVKV